MAALAAGNALRNVDRGERQSVSLHRVGSCGRDRAGHRNHRDRRSAVARPGVARLRRKIEEGRMRPGLERLRLGAVLLAVLPALAGAAQSAETAKKPVVINPPPTAQDWADLAKLPDWSGVWNPKVTDQDAQVRTNPPPWNEQAAKKIQLMFAEEKAGRPRLIFH